MNRGCSFEGCGHSVLLGSDSSAHGGWCGGCGSWVCDDHNLVMLTPGSHPPAAHWSTIDDLHGTIEDTRLRSIMRRAWNRVRKIGYDIATAACGVMVFFGVMKGSMVGWRRWLLGFLVALPFGFVVVAVVFIGYVTRKAWKR